MGRVSDQAAGSISAGPTGGLAFVGAGAQPRFAFSKGDGGPLDRLDVSATTTTLVGRLSVSRTTTSEVVSVGANATGGGLIQVSTSGGKPAVVLASNPTGVIEVGSLTLSDSTGKAVATLGAGGLTTEGGVAATGQVTSGLGISAAGQVQAGGWVFAQGGVSAKSTISTDGQVTAKGWVTTEQVLSAKGQVQAGGSLITQDQVQAVGWVITQGGVSAKSTLATDGQVTAKGWITSDQVVLAKGQLQTNDWLIAQAGVSSKGAVNATGWVHSNGGFQLDAPGRTQAYMSGGADGGYLYLRNKDNKNVVGNWVAASKAGVVAVFDANGNMAHWLDGAGPKNFVMAHPKDPSKSIVYGCIEGPEAAAYLRGRASLAVGRARVEFPEHFALVINVETLTVQLTPRSAGSKGLALVDQDAGGFSVQELLEGTGSYEFDYFAAGVRRGYEHYEPVVKKGFSGMGHAMIPMDDQPEPNVPLEATLAVAEAAPPPSAPPKPREMSPAPAPPEPEATWPPVPDQAG